MPRKVCHIARLLQTYSNNVLGEFSPQEVPVPVCNRCHHIIHHGRGESIVHPTLQSIHQIISESPHRYNHVYHILDAADFPLSIIPQLHRRLNLTPQRSINRRAKSHKFYEGREAELSFIITRADLLAPQKQQVDSLMPYLVQVLRDALRSTSEDIRLGNVRCVSATRGWWTKQVKEDILTRGGGAWMVGKVNVGKSQLLECIYPKGRLQNTSTVLPLQSKEISLGTEKWTTPSNLTSFKSLRPGKEKGAAETLGTTPSSESFLMPPTQAERQFPVLPLVSALPGTTVSPIRLPFGGGQGELFDLPGLPRSTLEDHVMGRSKSDLVMRHRVKPKQYVIGPGKSLLLGGLIRIAPASSDVTLLAHPFVPLTTHFTRSEKAIAIHTQQDAPLVPTIARPGTGQKMSLAGTFPLKWDVTKQRSGPLTAKAAAGLKTKDLPFLIFATDILIEGCGWVEVAAQVRRKDWEAGAGNGGGLEGIAQFPAVEVWSPNGDYVAQRRPMNGWALSGLRQLASSRRTARPRRSMKGAKKRLKGKI